MRPSRDIGRRRRPRQERQRLLVVTEGEVTEPQYVQGLLQHFRRSGVTVRSALTKGVGRDPVRVLQHAERVAREDPEGFDSVWLLVDVDDHAHLDECLRGAAREGYMTVVSNPCFEIWLLWHFQDLDSQQSRTWLRHRLQFHGQDGKALKANFPYRDYASATDRASDARRRVAPGQKGGDPSTAMPHLVRSICDR
ncbi:RloB family protein [Ornithinimicrobium sp. LYQ121]|uniref:RloB family protein n=1 Tax=Ornithinimicrobium sp. LYQ121 TaxID=3378801 RepID=UPI003852DA46